jgi:Flp pilus assembly protein TadD
MGALTERVSALRVRGIAALARNDVATALADLRIVTALTPKDNGAQKAYAAALIRSNKHRDGMAVLRMLLDREPNDLELHCVLGELCSTMLDHHAALGHFRRCLELDPRSQSPHGVRARVLIRKMEHALEDQLVKK